MVHWNGIRGYGKARALDERTENFIYCVISKC